MSDLVQTLLEVNATHQQRHDGCGHTLFKQSADEITRLQAENEALKSQMDEVRRKNHCQSEQLNRYAEDNEALRARVAELDGKYQELMAEKGVIGRKNYRSLVLRKQAQAVETMCTEWKAEAKWIINGEHTRWQKLYAAVGQEYAQSLRNSAEQIERGGSDADD